MYIKYLRNLLNLYFYVLYNMNNQDINEKIDIIQSQNTYTFQYYTKNILLSQEKSFI